MNTEKLLLLALENKITVLSTMHPAHGFESYRAHCLAMQSLAVALAAVRGTPFTVTPNA